MGVYVLQTSVTWTTPRLAWDLRQKTFPRALTLTYRAATTLIGISYVIGATLVLRDGSLRWIVGTHQALSLLVMLGFCYALLGLIVGRHTNLADNQRRSARCFGWLLLGGVLIIPASSTLPSPTYLFGFAAGMLWISCAPLLWLHRHARPYQQLITPEEASSAMAVLARRYGITRREQEIMALLVEGKSNKEIEDLLCISFSTVKNHVYNLYRKLEVSSRAQLMHLVMVESARQEPRHTPVSS